MGMSRTGSVLKRRVAAAVVFLTLLFLLVTSQVALAKVTVSIDRKGMLIVTSDSNDDITIDCVKEGGVGYVIIKVSGKVLYAFKPNGHSAKCTDVKKIFVDGGRGNNKINLQGVQRENFPNIEDVLINGGDGDDDIVGSDYEDHIYGGEGNDAILGEDGDDRIYGGGGDDMIDGGDGSDALEGGDGRDILHGGPGGDRLLGGAGHDSIYGGEGDDIADGGDGDDIYDARPGSTDTMIDSSGSDTLDFSDATSGITLDMDLADLDQVVDAVGNTVRIEGQLENFVGSAFDDVVSVDPLDVPRSIDGGTGDDSLNFDAKGVSVTDNGTAITAEGFAPVTYANFEAVNITNALGLETPVETATGTAYFATDS
jgi:Ca2+-binding RTX toxin-like protein